MEAPKASQRVARLKTRQAQSAPVERAERKSVVAYLRVSSEGQFSDGFGLEVQERSVKAFAESQSYDLVEIVSEKASGAVAPDERPGFSRVLKMARRREFSTLLLPRFDRLARHVVHAVNTVHDLRNKHGITVRSVTEPIDTSTPMGEMIFTVLASMAAQERQLITERTWGGRREKATKGGFAGGATPIGYVRDKDGGLSVDDESAEVVRRIFAMRAEGVYLRQIAEALNKDGLKTRRGKKWWASGVHYILDNPKYQGYVEYLFRYGGETSHVFREGDHQAIV